MIYKTIGSSATAELTEKKSRFICILTPVDTLEAAEEMLAAIRRQYPGARHYCFAFRIRTAGTITEKYSDDGEPNSTAGVPMLNILQKQELENVLVVVVRYFGGTLLGTGGLVRAYSGAVIQCLDQAEIVTMEYAARLNVTLDYSYYGNFQNKCQQHFNQITDVQFGGQVRIEGWIAEEKLARLNSLLDDITARTAMVESLEHGFVPIK